MQVKRSDTITTDGIVIKQDPGLVEIENSNKQKLIESIQEQTHQVLTQIQTQVQPHMQQTDSMITESVEKIEVDANGKVKKKRKYKKKPPKPKPPKPGQVHIATALDGTILFCCPECQMAYAEKTDLEQHLTVHKIGMLRLNEMKTVLCVWVLTQILFQLNFRTQIHLRYLWSWFETKGTFGAS